jgi:hypothetical protein
MVPPKEMFSVKRISGLVMESMHKFRIELNKHTIGFL